MLNPFEKKRMKQNLIKEIKEEFPKEEKQDPLINNEIELLHRGLDEGNNIYVEYFLSMKSEFSRAELAISDNKSRKELKEATDAVSSQLDLNTVMQIIADRARTLLNAKTLLIPVLSKDCDEYTYIAGSGENTDEIVGESLPLDFGICGWVWKHKRPWWLGVLDELDDDDPPGEVDDDIEESQERGHAQAPRGSVASMVSSRPGAPDQGAINARSRRCQPCGLVA